MSGGGDYPEGVSSHFPSFEPPGTGGTDPQWAPQQPIQQQPTPYPPAPQQSAQQQYPTPYPMRRPVLDQRPAVLSMAATMSFMASLQFVCVLGFVWLVAWTGMEVYDPNSTTGEGALFTLASRMHGALKYGLFLPMFGIPTIALVTSWFPLIRQQWGRIVHTAVGILALGWSAWWLRDRLEFWIAPALYIGFCCVVVWTPGVNRWLRKSAPTDPG